MRNVFADSLSERDHNHREYFSIAQHKGVSPSRYIPRDSCPIINLCSAIPPSPYPPGPPAARKTSDCLSELSVSVAETRRCTCLLAQKLCHVKITRARTRQPVPRLRQRETGIESTVPQ